jgi:VanZ family protein
MVVKADAIYHLSLLFVLSMIFLPLKRSSLVVLLLVIPGLIKIVQFFVPGRVPDFIGAFHGYLGIFLAYCLIQMWREIWPAVKKFRLHLQRQ